MLSLVGVAAFSGKKNPERKSSGEDVKPWILMELEARHWALYRMYEIPSFLLKTTYLASTGSFEQEQVRIYNL